MQKSKKIIRDIVVGVAVLTLIFVRIIVPQENCLWINAINFAGIIMACISLYIDIFNECKNLEKINLFTGICVCIFVVLIILEILVVLNIIKFSTLWNDLITLFVLLISLPSRLYTQIFAKILK